MQERRIFVKSFNILEKKKYQLSFKSNLYVFKQRVEPRRPSLPQIASDDEEESIPFNNQPQFRSGQDFDRRDRPQLDISEEVE